MRPLGQQLSLTELLALDLEEVVTVRVMVVRGLGLLPFATMLAGCGYQGPPLAGYEGLQFKVKSFYEARAFEKNATCNRPRMTPTRATVVEETPERVVMNVRYHFRDENIDFDDDDGFPPFGGGGALGRCDDWAERTFTLVKRTDGGVDVVAMSGPQRRLGPNSALAPRTAPQ